MGEAAGGYGGICLLSSLCWPDGGAKAPGRLKRGRDGPADE